MIPTALEDRWLASRLATVTRDVTKAIDDYKFAEAARLGKLGRMPFVATKQRLRGKTISYIRSSLADEAAAVLEDQGTPAAIVLTSSANAVVGPACRLPRSMSRMIKPNA